MFLIFSGYISIKFNLYELTCDNNLFFFYTREEILSWRGIGKDGAVPKFHHHLPEV